MRRSFAIACLAGESILKLAVSPQQSKRPKKPWWTWTPPWRSWRSQLHDLTPASVMWEGMWSNRSVTPCALCRQWPPRATTSEYLSASWTTIPTWVRWGGDLATGQCHWDTCRVHGGLGSLSAFPGDLITPLAWLQPERRNNGKPLLKCSLWLIWWKLPEWIQL